MRDKIREWYGIRWWAPNALKSRALTDTVHGIYLPYWTFDAQVHADWTAEAGYHYYETESYTDAQGRRQTRQVQRTRWVPASGSIEHFFDDELVPASKGVDAALLRKIEPFPTTTDLKPYDPGFLSGWAVEQYQIDLIAAAQHSREIMDRKLARSAPPKCPATRNATSTSTPITARRPSSTSSCRSGCSPTPTARRSYQVVINGYTGAIAGKHPLSWVKITLAVLAILIVVAVIFAMQSQAR